MNEWAVFGVIVSLFAFIVAVVKPIASLTKTITRLTVQIEGLREDMKEQKNKVHASFTKVWNHEEDQDRQIADHERRLCLLETYEE